MATVLEESIMTGANEESGPPAKIEGKNLALAICWVLGLGSLICWNSMLTMLDYYYEVFPNYHPSRVLTLVYQPFAFGSIVILAYNEAKLNTRRRNVYGYFLYFISSSLLIVLNLSISGKGGIGPYIVLCAIVGSFGLSDALVQGGMVGELALMCPQFIQSFMAGLAASGALTSGLRLITRAAFQDFHNGLRKWTMLFLEIFAAFEIICIILYGLVFPEIPIVKYYRKKAALEGSKTVSADLAAAGIKIQSNQDGAYISLSKKQLFVMNMDYFVGVFLIYVLTLSIFLGFLYENTRERQLGTWYPLVLIAMYNVLDLVGRYVPLINWAKLESRKCLFIVILCRFLLVPAFYFTAKYGDQGWMILLTSFLGLSNGYLTVCVFTAVPKGYKAPEQNALGNMLVLFLLGGIFAGVALNWLWIIGSGKF